MKFLHALFGVLLYASLLVVAAVLMVDGVTGSTNLGRQIQGHTAFYAGAALFLLVSLFGLTGIRVRRELRYLSLKTEGGSIRVSVQAIHALLSRLVDEFPDIISLRPQVRPRNGEVDVGMSVRIRGGDHVTDTCQLLQQRVRESLADNLGILAVRQVRVSVRELIPVPRAAAPRADGAAEPAAEEEEYQGIG